jgi:hypothetical protein
LSTVADVGFPKAGHRTRQIEEPPGQNTPANGSQKMIFEKI